MADLVDPNEIEQIVGMPRHPTRHYARAVSTEQTVYILHSAKCREETPDLRDCLYSRALDKGVDRRDWSGSEDQAVLVTINRQQRLIPSAPGMRLTGHPQGQP